MGIISNTGISNTYKAPSTAVWQFTGSSSSYASYIAASCI